jgi:hypothetical protein
MREGNRGEGKIWEMGVQINGSNLGTEGKGAEETS